MASVSQLAPIHLGLDVHKDTISVGILGPDQQVPDVERIVHDEPSVRRLVGRFGDPRMLRACYEAGPTGFELARLLKSMGVSCQVIAPSLIPRAPGDKVKTDRRDCRRLARLHRAGELTCVRIPTVQEEAVRDLCRTRADMVADLTRARNRLGKFLLRHGRPWRGGSTRTHAYQAWLRSQRFDQPAMTQTFGHYLAVVEAATPSWTPWKPTWSAGASSRRSTGRSPGLAPTEASPGWARSPWPPRSPTGAALPPRMRSWASAAWSPANTPAAARSTGAGSPRPATRTCAPSWPGSAWSYQHRPWVGVELARRQQGLDPAVTAQAWAAQQRLAARFRRLAARKHTKSIVAAAIARELAGFLWAEMTAA